MSLGRDLKSSPSETMAMAAAVRPMTQKKRTGSQPRDEAQEAAAAE